MVLANIIEVIVGLVFTWFVISTATVQIQEWFAARLRWRANDLESAIAGMLNDANLTKLFYSHPIIRSLSGQEGNEKAKPSYIPAQQFSTVLLNIILDASSESAPLVHGLYSLPDELGRIKSHARRQQAEADLERLIELARLPATTESGSAVDSLILVTLEKELNDLGERYGELKEPIEALRQKADKERDRISSASQELPKLKEAAGDMKRLLKGTLALGSINPSLRLALSSLLIGIEKPETQDGDFLARFQANIERWFNDTMDRLSGWYKRKAQWMAFLIGVSAALLLNIDTLHIAGQLWREPALREAISQRAEAILQEYDGTNSTGEGDPLAALELLQEQYLGMPIGWNLVPVEPAPAQSCAFAPGAGQVFGVQWQGSCARPAGADSHTNGWVWVLAKIAGLLLTGVASAQGSSFWFDLLMKIVNVRSAGIKPD